MATVLDSTVEGEEAADFERTIRQIIMETINTGEDTKMEAVITTGVGDVEVGEADAVVGEGIRWDITITTIPFRHQCS